MGRPFWLDIVYLTFHLGFPLFVATRASVMIVQWMNWPRFSYFLVLLVIGPLSIALWLWGLTRWEQSRTTTPLEAESGPRIRPKRSEKNAKRAGRRRRRA